jgi:hypothetical protein
VSDGITFTISSWGAGMPAPVIDSLGCVWYLTDYKGWAGSPAPRTNVIDREQSDGQFDGPAWQPGRQITLDGKVICPSNYVMHEAMDMFNALLVAGSRTGTMTAVEPHLTRQAVVRRDAENDFTPVGNTDALFSLILYAPDSNRYGSVLNTASTGVFQASSGRAYPLAFPRAYGAGSSAGTVTITNNGDIPHHHAERRVWADGQSVGCPVRRVDVDVRLIHERRGSARRRYRSADGSAEHRGAGVAADQRHPRLRSGDEPVPV